MFIVETENHYVTGRSWVGGGNLWLPVNQAMLTL